MGEQRFSQRKGGGYTLQKTCSNGSRHWTLQAVRTTRGSPETRALSPDKSGRGLYSKALQRLHMQGSAAQSCLNL